MKSLRKKIKSFKKRDLKYLSIGRALSILRERKELIAQKKNSKVERQKIDQEFNKKIDKISKINSFKYLRHINGDGEGGGINSLTKADNLDKKAYNLEKLIEENKEIKYRSLFV